MSIDVAIVDAPPELEPDESGEITLRIVNASGGLVLRNLEAQVLGAEIGGPTEIGTVGPGSELPVTVPFAPRERGHYVPVVSFSYQVASASQPDQVVAAGRLALRHDSPVAVRPRLPIVTVAPDPAHPGIGAAVVLTVHVDNPIAHPLEDVTVRLEPDSLRNVLRLDGVSEHVLRIGPHDAASVAFELTAVRPGTTRPVVKVNGRSTTAFAVMPDVRPLDVGLPDLTIHPVAPDLRRGGRITTVVTLRNNTTLPLTDIQVSVAGTADALVVAPLEWERSRLLGDGRRLAPGMAADTEVELSVELGTTRLIARADCRLDTGELAGAQTRLDLWAGHPAGTLWYVANEASDTREYHAEACAWQCLMDEDHRRPFQSVLEPLRHRFNGCAHCLGQFSARTSDGESP